MRPSSSPFLFAAAAALGAVLATACGGNVAEDAPAPEETQESAEAQTASCTIVPDKSLWIRDARVVDSAAAATGALSFDRLVRDLMPRGSNVTPREFLALSPVRECTLAPADCARMNTAPLLVGVVNRLDRVDQRNPVGELRLVYQVFEEFDPTIPTPVGRDKLLPTFLNFEFDLSAVRSRTGKPIGRAAWAKAFHELDALPLGSAKYVERLAAIVLQATGRDAAPGRPNGSPLNALRVSREGWYPGRDGWTLSSLVIADATHPEVRFGRIALGQMAYGGLDSTPEGYEQRWSEQEPYERGRKSSLFSVLIDNETQILAGEPIDFPVRKVGQAMVGDPLWRAGSIDVAQYWQPAGADPRNLGVTLLWEQRNGYGPAALPQGWTPERWNHVSRAFAATTCNHCHGVNTSGNHIEARAPGSASALSRFITAQELPKRASIMKKLVCRQK